jgi:integrase
MASLHKDPRGKSPFFYVAFTHVDGTRAFKSTKMIKRNEANEVARGWQRAVDLARRGDLTEAKVHTLKSEICERGNVVLHKHQAFIAEVLGEIHERANGERINFASVADYLHGWINSKELTAAKSTARRYGDVVKAFLAHLGAKAKRSLSSVTARDVGTFRDLQLKAGKASKTANMAVKTLRIPFNLARRQGLILSNPAEAVEMLPENSVTRDTFTREQIADLLKVADPEWRGMILLGACHGLRIGDAARLTWGNIDMERRSIRFFPQKDRKAGKRTELEIPIHADVENYLLSLPVRSNQPDAPLFSTLSQKKGTGDKGLCTTFARLIEEAGIHREAGTDRVKGKGRRVFTLGFHSFRHTAISELANSGVTKERRMRLSGHKSAVHERYTHHELETLRGEVERVPSFVRSEPAS